MPATKDDAPAAVILKGSDMIGEFEVAVMDDTAVIDEDEVMDDLAVVDKAPTANIIGGFEVAIMEETVAIEEASTKDDADVKGVEKAKG